VTHGLRRVNKARRDRSPWGAGGEKGAFAIAMTVARELGQTAGNLRTWDAAGGSSSVPGLVPTPAVSSNAGVGGLELSP
jgi:hypothetical protein